MNAVADILTRCKSSGILLTVNCGAIKARGPTEYINALLPSIRQHKPELIRALTARRAVDLEGLAQDISTEFNVSTADVLALLDDDDRQAITTDRDPDRAKAWRATVHALIAQGLWEASKPAPSPPPSTVRCVDCQWSKPTEHPVLVECLAGRAAPGASGQWWGLDFHSCDDYCGGDAP
jgi:hypothetical protein